MRTRLWLSLLVAAGLVASGMSAIGKVCLDSTIQDGLPEQFALTAELPALAESADALLWSVSRCLTALQGWLQARQQGALALDLAWRHDLRRIDGVAIAPTQALPVRTAQATQDMAHLRRLLSENLARTTQIGRAHV